MLRTRLWMGAALIGVGLLILLEHPWLAPWYPVFAVCYGTASFLAARELLNLLPAAVRPNPTLTCLGVLGVAAANWTAAVGSTPFSGLVADAWPVIGLAALAALMAAFIREMWCFVGPQQITVRLALTALVLVYLGILPSFLAQLRWLPGERSTAALALAVFVPKGNDIGAYFTGKFLTGRILGRHHMTPLLSPKKTWQGFVGGMLISVAVTVVFNQRMPILPHGLLGEVAFGIVVGGAGVLGDLAESLLKRDLQTKDASQTVPGFGGVLDVVDSLLFAAPVAYLWIKLTG